MLVVAEIAIALVLVVGAALLIRTLVALQHVDMGFNGDRVLTASIAPPRGQYRDPAALRQLYQRLLDRASAIPGVRSAGLTNMLPLSGGDFMLSFRIEGRPPAATPGDEPVAGARIVSASYVSTMGMRIVQGRDLSPLDTENAPGAVLVNETMAQALLAGRRRRSARRSLINDLEADGRRRRRRRSPSRPGRDARSGDVHPLPAVQRAAGRRRAADGRRSGAGHRRHCAPP